MSRSAIYSALCLAGATIMLLAIGCSNDDPVSTCTVPGAKMVTVHFEERPDCLGCDFIVVFTSDLDGNMHDYALRTDETEIELEVPPSAGSDFYVTHMFNTNNSPLTKILTTHHSVNDDREVFRLLGYSYCGGRRTELHFANIPEHEEYVLGAEPCVLGKIGQLPDQKQILVYRDPLDLLLTIDPVGAPRSYMWLKGVEGWSEPVFDLDDLVPLTGHMLALPPVSRDIFINVAAWPVEAAADPDHKVYILDTHRSPPGSTEAVLEVGSPDFARYEVRAQTSVSSNFTRILVTTMEGPLPGSISFWNPEIEIQASSPDGFLIGVVEGTEEMDLGWRQDGDILAEWEIHVPVSSQPAVLPMFPEFVETLFPSLVREDFYIRWVSASRQFDDVADDGRSMKVVQESSLFGFPDEAR